MTNDVYALPGLQDITASVDFTALAEAGTGAGSDLAGYCAQASLLIGNGLATNLLAAEARAHDEAARYKLRQEATRLTLPGERDADHHAFDGRARCDGQHAGRVPGVGDDPRADAGRLVTRRPASLTHAPRRSRGSAPAPRLRRAQGLRALRA